MDYEKVFSVKNTMDYILLMILTISQSKFQF